MKRLHLVIISLLFPLLLCAQHLEFMGIPLDGTITQFQAKLIKKGFHISKLSKALDKGIRAYNGRFSGRKVVVATYYNPKSKNVYAVRVMLDDDSFKNGESAFDVFDYYTDLINAKYSDISKEDTDDKATTENARRHYAITVYHDSTKETIRGTIRIQVVENTDYYNTYYVTLDYVDGLNSFLSGFIDYIEDMNDL